MSELPDFLRIKPIADVYLRRDAAGIIPQVEVMHVMGACITKTIGCNCANPHLLLERVGVRRISTGKSALFDPFILTFSRWEKGLFSTFKAITGINGRMLPTITDG